MAARARQIGGELGHEGRDHAVLGTELLQIGFCAHGAVGGGERGRMGERELDGAVPELRVHGNDRRAHLLHAPHEGLEEGAERRQADQAVGVAPARDRRERGRRGRARRLVRMVDEDLVLEREARHEAHGGGLVGGAPEHGARAFGRHGAVRVVEVEHRRHRVRAPGQAAHRGGVRLPVDVGESVLVGGERREIDIVRGGEAVDDVGEADLGGDSLVEGEQLAAQPAVEFRDLDLDEAHAVGTEPRLHRLQPLGLGPAHGCAPAGLS